MVSIKFSNQGIPPMLAATVRSGAAALCLWVLTGLKGDRVWLRGPDLKYGIIIGVLFGLDFLFLYWGTAFTNASRAIIFLYTHPFWVALGAHFFLPDDRLTPMKIGGLVLAFTGMASVFGSGSGNLPAGYWIGDLMEIAAAIFWAATTIYIKRVAKDRPITHYQTLFSQLIYSMPVLAAGWIAFEYGNPISLTGPVLAALGYQCLVVAFFSYVLWFWMIHTYPVSRLAAFTFLAPIFGVIFGGVLMGDSLPLLLWVGLVCVAGGIYLVNRPAAGLSAG
jgi:drug/metabolite transporter (DMT)-like permease